MGIEALFTPQVPQADWRMILATRHEPNQWLQSLSQGVNLGAGLADLYRQGQFRQSMQDMAANGGMDTEGLMKALTMYGDPKYLAALAPEMYREQMQRQAIDLAQKWRNQEQGGDGSGGVVSGMPNRETESYALLAGANPALAGFGTISQMRNARDLENYKMGSELVKYYDPATGTMRQAPRSQIPNLGVGPQQQVPPTGGNPQSSLNPENLPDIGKYQNNPYFSDALGVARTFDIDPKIWMALITKESGWDPSAQSNKGAMGLVQLMPDTAKRFGVSDPLNPQQNLMGGGKYLRWLLDRYNGDYVKALAAFNSGEGTVDKYGGVPPYTETQNYVRSVLINARKQPVVTTDTGRQVYPRVGPSSIPVAGQTATTMPLTVAQPGAGVQIEPSLEEKSRQEVETARERARATLPIEQQGKTLDTQREIDYAYKIAEQKNLAQKDVDRVNKWQDDAENATKSIEFLENAQRLLDQGAFKSGRYASLKSVIGEWLYSSGLINQDNPLVKQAYQARDYESIANSLTLSTLGGKLGGQVSNADVTFVKDIFPKIGDNDVTARQVLSILQKNYQRQIEKNDAWILAKETNPNLRVSEFEKQWQQHIKQVWAQEDKAARAQGTPVQVTGGENKPNPGGSYILRFPGGKGDVSQEEAEKWPIQVQKMIRERIDKGEVLKLRVP